MPRYTDGFVIPISKRKLPAYRRLAMLAGRVWMKHGALSYQECTGDDLKIAGITMTFPKLVRLKPGEIVMFSFITYKSRSHRDRVNAKAMSDPKMAAIMNSRDCPFDQKRMAYGGFKTIVDL